MSRRIGGEQLTVGDKLDGSQDGIVPLDSVIGLRSSWTPGIGCGEGEEKRLGGKNKGRGELDHATKRQGDDWVEPGLTISIDESESIHLESVSSEIVHDRDVGPGGDGEVLAGREGLERRREEGLVLEGNGARGEGERDKPVGRSCGCTRGSFGWREFGDQ